MPPSTNKPWLVPVLIAAGLLAFAFVYPRAIVAWLGEENPWTSYLYLYGFGFVMFCYGIAVILRSGSCKLGRGHETAWFGVLLGGFVFFASLHAVWIYLSLNIPYLGGE